MGISIQEQETIITWDYADGVVRGYTTQLSVANQWAKVFGEVTPLGHGYEFSTPIANVRKPHQIKRTTRTLTDDQRAVAAERLKRSRQKQAKSTP